MKKKSIFLLLLGLCFAFVMTGCGKQGDKEEQGEEKLTKAESSYIEEAKECLEDVAANEKLENSTDFTSAAAVEAYCGDTEECFRKLAELEAPESFTGAQEAFGDAYEKMKEYLDGLPAFCQMDSGEEEYNRTREELQELYTGAMGQIATGRSLIETGGEE